MLIYTTLLAAYYISIRNELYSDGSSYQVILCYIFSGGRNTIIRITTIIYNYDRYTIIIVDILESLIDGRRQAQVNHEIKIRRIEL